MKTPAVSLSQRAQRGHGKQTLPCPFLLPCGMEFDGWGRCVALGDGFVWLVLGSLPRSSPRGAAGAALVGPEALRTLELVAQHSMLSDTEVEGIFTNNAKALFGL